MEPMLTETVISKHISSDLLNEVLKKHPDVVKFLTEPLPFAGKTAEEIHNGFVENEASVPSYADKLKVVARLAHMLLPEHFNNATYFEASLRSEINLELTSLVMEIFTDIEKMRKADQEHSISEINYSRINVNMDFLNQVKTIENLKLKSELEVIDAEYKEKLEKAKKERYCLQCHRKAKAICCFYAAYCTRRCQKAHWVNHAIDCCRDVILKSKNQDLAEKAGNPKSAVNDKNRIAYFQCDSDKDLGASESNDKENNANGF